MNVNSADSAASLNDEVSRREDKQTGGGKEFAKVLDRKKAGQPDTSDDQAAAGQPQLQQPQDPTARTSQDIETSKAAPAPPSVNALASEIVKEVRVVAPPGQPPRIDIEFNSKTLDGLKVQIGKQDGGLAISFTARNDQVGKLLSENVAALSESLAANGYQVSKIEVKTPAASVANDRSGATDSREGRTWDRGRSGGNSGGGQRR